jgi:hypothetical protein
LNGIQEVSGSIPLGSTKLKGYSAFFLLDNPSSHSSICFRQMPSGHGKSAVSALVTQFLQEMLMRFFFAQ